MYSNQLEELKELFTYDQTLEALLEEPRTKSISLIKEAYQNAQNKDVFMFALIAKLTTLHSRFCKTA